MSANYEKKNKKTSKNKKSRLKKGGFVMNYIGKDYFVITLAISNTLLE